MTAGETSGPGIQQYILRAFVFLIIVTLCISGVAVYSLFSNLLVRFTEQNLRLEADARFAMIDSRLSQLEQDLSFLAISSQNLEGLGGDRDWRTSQLNAFCTHIIHCYDAFYISPEGVIEQSVKAEVDLGTDLYTGPYSESMLGLAYRRAVISGEIELSRLSWYPPSEQFAQFWVVPIKQDNTVIGVYAVQLAPAFFKAMSKLSDRLGRTGEVLLAANIEGQPTLIAPLVLSDARPFEYVFDSTDRSLPVLEALAGRSGMGPAVDYRHEDIIAVWMPLPRTGWGLVVKMDVEEVFLAQDELLKMLLLVFGLCILLSILVSTWISRFISRPISGLTAAVQQAAQSQDLRPVEVSGSAEISKLATSYNQLVLRLHAARAEVESVNSDLETIVQQRTAELIETNQELSATMRQLRDTKAGVFQTEKLASLGLLAAGVGHELNNPLMGILNYVEYAESRVQDEKVRGVLQKAIESVGRMKTILTSMMTYASSAPQAAELVHWADIVAKVTDLMAADLRHADVVLSVEIDEDLPPILASGSELYQSVLNVMLNALYVLKSSDVKRLRVRGYQVEGQQGAAGEVLLDISDSGPGVPDEKKSKIFDPFFTTKPVGKGTGLGLSVTRNLVEKHGGEISIHDAEEGGALFRFKFKVAEENP